MEDRWFGNEFQILGATDENDLEVAMVVLRVGPGRAHSQHCQLYFGSVTALYMRARDRSAQGPGFSLGGPVYS